MAGTWKGRLEILGKTEVLVIGSGGAALRAALSAAEQGAAVIVLTKGVFGKSGATYCSVAEIGAFNVPDGAIDPEDTPDVFYQDIMDAALGMADPRLVRILADEAIEAKEYLERGGMQFARKKDGGYMGYRACFSSRARSHVVQNHFQPIMHTLLRLAAQSRISVMEHTAAVDLIVQDGACIGAYVLRDGTVQAVLAKSVILAAGGGSTLFRRNLYPDTITGDGYAMAWRAGARMENMEFLQAGIGLAWPQPNLFGNQLWQMMPRITNGEGERFLARYAGGAASEAEIISQKGGHFPFSTRDCSKYVEIAVQSEIRQGRPTPRGNVYLDFLETDFSEMFRRNPDFKEIWQLTYDRFRELGVDLYREKIEIACFAHAINGGVRIDAQGASTVPGLYAAGEIAAGPHGADRLGGNMALTCQVFGKRAGAAAAAYARAVGESCMRTETAERERERLRGFGSVSREMCRRLLEEAQETADRTLLIVRDQAGLQRFLKESDMWLEQLRTGDSADDRVPLEELLSLESRIITGRMIAMAALRRRESRGSHFRRDYPVEDPAFAAPYGFSAADAGQGRE